MKNKIEKYKMNQAKNFKMIHNSHGTTKLPEWLAWAEKVLFCLCITDRRGTNLVIFWTSLDFYKL